MDNKEDKVWQKKRDKAAAKYLDGKNVIAADKALIGNKKGVALTTREPEKVETESIDGWPVSVLLLKNMLSVKDLITLLSAREHVEWHPMYEREHWRDKNGPLKLVEIWQMPGEKEETWMIMYKCANPDCLGCCHPTSPAGKFHHKLIRPDGMDSTGRCEEIQMGRKKSQTISVDMPVFKLTEFSVADWMDPDHPDPWALADSGLFDMFDDRQRGPM